MRWERISRHNCITLRTPKSRRKIVCFSRKQLKIVTDQYVGPIYISVKGEFFLDQSNKLSQTVETYQGGWVGFIFYKNSRKWLYPWSLIPTSFILLSVPSGPSLPHVPPPATPY